MFIDCVSSVYSSYKIENRVVNDDSIDLFLLSGDNDAQYGAISFDRKIVTYKGKCMYRCKVSLNVVGRENVNYASLSQFLANEGRHFSIEQIKIITNSYQALLPYTDQLKIKSKMDSDKENS